MKQQHCGRLDKHEPHEFSGRPRKQVIACTCDDNPCSCDSIEVRSGIRRPLECTGDLVTEGAPPHMPTIVG
jgi:hypothetical protein